MTDATEVCDRCKRRIEVFHSEEGAFTGGYYDVRPQCTVESESVFFEPAGPEFHPHDCGGCGGEWSEHKPTPWSKYANPGECVVCDNCMFSDPRYIDAYGRYDLV